MHNRAMREYTARRGWTIAIQVREVNSGAARREAREKLLETARRREIDLVLVWRLDRWGRSLSGGQNVAFTDGLPSKSNGKTELSTIEVE